MRFGKAIILGEIAAFLVPLFLSFLSSDLVTTIVKPAAAPGEAAPSLMNEKLVLFGFGLVAAVFSQRFIDDVARHALKVARQTRDKVATLDAEIEDITETLEEPEVDPEGARLAAIGDATDPPSPKAIVLNELRSHDRFVRRTVGGLSTDTQLPTAEVTRLLTELEQDGLAQRLMSRTGDRELWSATRAGRAALVT